MKDYRHIYREKKSLISSEAHLRQYIDHRDIYGSIHKYAFLYAENGVVEELHRNTDNLRWHRLGKKLLRRDFVVQLFKNGRIIRANLKSFLAKLNRLNLKTLSDDQLSNLFLEAYRIYSRFRGYFKTSRPEFESVAEDKLKKLLLKKLTDPEEVQTVFEVLTSSGKLDEVNKEFIDWVALLSKHPKVEETILKHLYKYPWVVAQSFDLKGIISTMRRKYYHDRKELRSLRLRVAELKHAKAELRVKQRILFIKFNNKQINYLGWLFRELGEERFRLKGGWSGADFLYLPLYLEISRRSNIPLGDLCSSYRLGEVLQAIKNHQPIVSRAELKKRKAAYVLWLKRGKLFFFCGDDAEEIISQELKHIYKKLDTSGLKGQIASSGIAKGRARIIVSGNISMLKQAFRDFRKGNVMVTTMTQPNMVPLMRKAAAIVTDEGGLVSHAAILAREFKIPCIVGTEIGTRIFRNGDLVEVDANKGIVRKLK